MSSEDREMCHHMQNDGEFWYVHHAQQDTTSPKLFISEAPWWVEATQMSFVWTGWRWRISAGSLQTSTSAAYVPTSWMEALPVTGEAPAMRADGWQESLLEDASITSVVRHLSPLLGSSHLPKDVKGFVLLISGMFVPPESFWTNPQYRVKVDKLLSECSSSDNDKTMLVSLMQKPDKRNRRLVQNLHIGFSVFEVSLTIYRFLGGATETS